MAYPPQGTALPIHGAAKHSDVTRELFIPALDDSDPNATLAKLGNFLVVQCADTFDVVVAFTFKVPDDFVSFVSVKAVWSSPAASGNMFWTLNSHYGAAGEAYNAHGETPGVGELATGGANVINVQTSPTALTLADLAGGDYVGIKFDRRGSGPEDSLNADVSLLGILFTYIAEQ